MTSVLWAGFSHHDRDTVHVRRAVTGMTSRSALAAEGYGLSGRAIAP
jgi:hypothetical protein